MVGRTGGGRAYKPRAEHIQAGRLQLCFAQGMQGPPGSLLPWVYRFVSSHCSQCITGPSTKLGTRRVDGKKHLKGKQGPEHLIIRISLAQRGEQIWAPMRRSSYLFTEVPEAFLEKEMPELNIKKEKSANQRSWERPFQAEAQDNSG